MNHVRVGVGVIVVKDDKVLMGKRIGSHGENSWSFPGGHLEMFESVHECAKREVKEETGIEIKNLQDVTFTNDIFRSEEKHYITLFVRAEYSFGEVKVLELDKCLEWKWCQWQDLPQPLFLPIEHLLTTGYNLYEGDVEDL